MARRLSWAAEQRYAKKRHATMAANLHVHDCEHCSGDTKYVCYKAPCKDKKKKLCHSCRVRKRFRRLPENQILLPIKHAVALSGFVEGIDGNWNMLLADGRSVPVTEDYARNGGWHAES